MSTRLLFRARSHHRSSQRGAGLITALGCDHRIAAEGALQFSLNEVLIGIPMPAVYCEMIKHTIGPRAASELTLLGRGYDLAAVVKMGVIGKTLRQADYWMTRWPGLL